MPRQVIWARVATWPTPARRYPARVRPGQCRCRQAGTELAALERCWMSHPVGDGRHRLGGSGPASSSV